MSTAARSGNALAGARPFTGSQLPPRPARQHRWRRPMSVLASAKADETLREAKRKYVTGDKMGALRLFEESMKQEPTQKQQQAAMYGATAVHAAFGDAELAQMTLREAILLGLDYEAALEDPEQVPLQTSQQIMIQLSRFNRTLQQAAANRAAKQAAAAAPAAPGGGTSGASSASERRKLMMSDDDLARIMGTPGSDEPGIDMSIGGTVRRVALVLLAGVGIGVVLFFVGLEYMFPKY